MAGRLIASLLIAIFTMFAQSVLAAPPAPARAPVVLTPGASIARQISAGQTHAYTVVLRAGDFLHATITPRAVEVSAAFAGPDGRERLTVRANDFSRPLHVMTTADTGGAYTLTVRTERPASSRGRYAVHVLALRPAVADDLALIDAERAFVRGRALRTASDASGYAEARDAFKEALERYRELGDREGEAKTLIEITRVSARLGRTDLLPAALDAERLARELDNRAILSAALHTLGLAYLRAGEMTRALESYEAAVRVYHDLGDRKGEAAALNDAGQIYGRTSDGQKALSRLQHALALARTAGDRRTQAVVLNNLGVTFKNLGEFERALEAYRRALAVRVRIGESPDAVILNNMGLLEHLLGQDQRALDLHRRALALSRASRDREQEARSLNTIGMSYAALGDPAKALDYCRQALDIRRAVGDLLGQGASLDSEGEALRRLGRTDEATAALEEALAIRKRIGDQTGQIETRRALALVQRDRGDRTAALDHIMRAVDLEESLRARITSPTLRSSFAAFELDKYEVLIDLLEERHASSSGGGDDAAALHAAERARARTLLDSVVGARVDLREGIDPRLLARERTLQRQLDDASAQLSRALARNEAAPERDAAASKLDELTLTYQQLQVEIRQQSPRYAAMMHPEPLDAVAIQKVVLDNETVLLEFALGADRSWLWAVTGDSILSVQLPPRRTIEAAARALYAGFVARQRHPGEPAAQYADRVAAADADLAGRSAAISRMLFGGIARQLSTSWRDKRLAIVATGALEYLPFAALPVPDGHQPMTLLAAQHELVTLPSASVLAVLRREAAARPRAPGAVAIVADPVFDRADPRVSTLRLQHAAHTATGRATSPQAVHAGPARLPFSREEADAIVSLAGRAGVLDATDFRASRATVLGGALDRYRIVHFATHGIVDSNRPTLSSLVLSLVDEQGMPRDGYLRLHDIYNLKLDADLVVLSACQTALGKEIKGEGLVGLTRAFMYAGTPRVVATLWEVSDVATAELMKRFYRGMLQQGLRPAAALRAAQLELRRDPRWAAPYYWAAFELQGDWR